MTEPTELSTFEAPAADRAGGPARIGLALSGGGFRASLFHIGVLARLTELDLLRRVQVLSCVSGGSIIGALYYLYLKRDIDAHGDLDSPHLIDLVAEMEQHFLDVVQQNLRWLTFADLQKNWKMRREDYSRTDRLGDVLDELLYRPVWNGGRRRPIEMRELKIHPRGDRSFHPETGNRERHTKVPILVLNATSLNTGHNWRFEAARMGEPPVDALHQDIDQNLHLVQGNYDDLIERQATMPLGQAVAASAGVPGIFPPFPISELYDNVVDPNLATDDFRVQLVDGGVHDNLGIEALRKDCCDFYVVSDASGQMPDQPLPATWLGAVVQRSSSILIDRIREEQLQRLRETHRGRVALMHLRRDLNPAQAFPRGPGGPLGESKGPTDGITSYGVERELQHRLGSVRTDLDAFTDVEASALAADGYLMTESELARLDHEAWGVAPPRQRAPWRFLAVAPLLQAGDAKLHRHLEVARHRLLKLPMLDASLRYSLGIAGMILAVAALSALILAWRDIQLEMVMKIWSIVALLVAFWPALLGLRKLADHFEPLRFLIKPLDWFSRWLAAVVLAPSLWLTARLQLVFNRRFLKVGRLPAIGLPPLGRFTPSGPGATGPAEGPRSERAA